jgi:NitT/TauT family transport system ATP-binding protein
VEEVVVMPRGFRQKGEQAMTVESEINDATEAAEGGGAVERVTHPSRVEVQNVSKDFGAGPLARRVVENCSFTVEPGQINVMIGPSGCGKSTLCFLVAGYERPTEGRVLIDGKPVGGPSAERLLLFQETALMPWLTTYQNVMFGPKARRARGQDIKGRADALIERVGLRDFRDKYPPQLSGGMQRRAELARALINDPKIMILDEPFRGLDAMTRTLMQEYYSSLFEEGRRTNLFITTDIDEAIFLADRLLIMENAPTKLRHIIDVNLPRPRNRDEVLTGRRAYEIKEEALEILHDEAVKSFASGNKAVADFVQAYTRRRGGEAD